MTRRIAIHIAALLLLLAAAAAPVWSQEKQDNPPLPEPLASWAVEIKDIGDTLKLTGDDDDALIALRERLDKLRPQLDEHTAKLKEEFGAVDSMLKELGPEPKPEETQESEAAAKVRKRLAERAADFDGSIRTVQVLQTRIGQLSNEIQDRRRDLFSSQLLKRVQSPLMPDVWRRAGSDSIMMLDAFGFVITNWWNGVRQPNMVFALLGASIVLWLALMAVSRRLRARYRWLDAGAVPPPPLERAASAAGVTIARAVPPIAAACLLIFGLSSLGMLPGTAHRIAMALLYAFCTVMALMALVQTVLAPNQSMWRIFPATDRDASRLRWLAWGIAIVFGLDHFFRTVNSTLAAPLPVTVALSFFTTVTVALLTAAMLRVRIGPFEQEVKEEQEQEQELALEPEAENKEEEDISPFSSSLPRLFLWMLVGAILVAVAFGYIALARFITTQMVITGSILILLWLIHLAIEDFAVSLSNAERPSGRWMATRLKVPDQRRSQVGILTSMILHLVMFAVFLPLIALQWGFDWEDLSTWLSKIVFGFQVGNWRISLATIVVALLLFIIGLIASGFFQRWLDVRVLTRAQLDQGARSAIRTGVGYIGIALAALIAVSYAGLDFSNIAIVAGALSVGIGFGLQSIVNNFVSGLILLAERRVSVGDRIVVGADEGYVRRISVRATEIETFDRNFVIIPNSDLMTNSVKNWTFQNRHGRVIIDIGVSYGSDPDLVKEILLKVGKEHPAIVDRDKVRVWFMDFADSALMFRLIAFVGDISYLLDTHSDMRFAIMREFRAAGVEIPFPQRDINLRDIDRLEAAILGGARPRRGKASES